MSEKERWGIVEEVADGLRESGEHEAAERFLNMCEDVIAHE